ncbi:MAG TPA: YggS family pyridoxal phosphate-dependent enzyme [Geminicoccaceae bacterium]|nr:YggS family pyridoxal phosphate-dependent enzyme [Geminicoccus sp.]HMU53259.1 YggS family pyridoxal phosphate-dependent enzyme [Geminicoccaceae bacterium]
MTEQTEQADPAAGLAEVRARIAAAAESAGRDPASVTLIAVGKAQPPDRIAAALAAGQLVFGENYVQEAAGRWPELRAAHPGIELHMIGALQTNKVREALALFDVVQTVDRPRLAEAVAKEAQRLGRAPRVLVQVNTGAEAQKAGVATGGLDALVDLCRRLELRLEGLMAIPPAGEDVAMHTALLAKLARRHGLAAVSCGMSADYETAIRFGATHVRVGTAIFGARARKAG